MTSAEIVKALRCCENGECGGCPLHSDKQHCQERLLGSTADLIERLEKEKAAMLESLRGRCVSCKHFTVNTMDCKISEGCESCREDCKCKDCGLGNNWEWKGLEGSE